MTQVSDTLAERGARYGDFTDHADLAQKLQDVMRDFMRPGDPRTAFEMLSPVKRQSLTVIMDNWHDIAGYAKLAEDRCVDTSAPGLPLEPADDADGWIGWADRYRLVSTDKPDFPAGAGNHVIEVETNAGVRTRGRHPEFDWRRIFGPYAIARWRFVK